MSNSLDNYHSWKSKIYDNSDEILFDEIVKCIDAQAYRSANIMICISFTESLYKKLEILAESNNKISQDLENYQEQGKDFLLIQGCPPKLIFGIGPSKCPHQALIGV